MKDCIVGTLRPSGKVRGAMLQHGPKTCGLVRQFALPLSYARSSLTRSNKSKKLHQIFQEITSYYSLSSSNYGAWVKLSDPLRRGLAEGWLNSRFLTVTAPGQQNDTQRPTAQSAPAPRYVPRPDPFQITDADFECSESYINEGGFDECELEVEIEVNIPSIFAPYLRDYVDVTCEAEISYRTQDSYFEQNERESESTSLYLYSGTASETLKIDFDFGYTFEPVVSAKVESLECHPD